MRLIFLVAVTGVLGLAHDPITTKLTWSQEISRLVHKRCSSCHRDGGAAPMPLVNYEQARPWAKAIKEEVLSRRMPPWGAVKGFGEFAEDASLTQEELNRIAQWVEGGAPEGEPLYAPGTLPQPATSDPVPGKRTRKTAFERPMLLVAIRPIDDAASDKITASMPDGRVEPLIWLHGYKAAWRRTFVLRQPLELAAGSKITTNTRLELIVRDLKRPR